MDAIISVHVNPLTSGVAKFNLMLADRLHVQCLRYGSPAAHATQHPLISVKCSEVAEANALAPHPVYSLFLHDWGGSFRDVHAVKGAVQVFAANGVIARSIREIRPDVVEAFCPSTVQGNPTRGAIDVLTFGMAHKFQGVHFERLKTLLDRYTAPETTATPGDYTVSVSTGIHEGSPWEPSFAENERLMRGIFGDHLRVLGFLADDALARELRTVTAVALFFEPAVRANNTSFWAAVDAGALVITNTDQDSPTPKGRSTVCNLASLDAWPSWPHISVMEGWPRYTWTELVGSLTAVSV